MQRMSYIGAGAWLIAAQMLGAAAPKDDITVAADAFYRCAEKLVAVYDDKISPANIIARVMASRCQVEALRWVNSMRATTSQDGANAIFTDLMRGDDANLIEMVLLHRVARISR